MRQNEEPIIIPLQGDFSDFETALNDLEKSSERFGRAFSISLQGAVRDGKSFEDTLKNLALRLSDIALQAGLKPLENAVGGFFQSTLSGLLGGASGGSGSSFDVGGLLGSIGGIVSSGLNNSAAPSVFAPPTFSPLQTARPSQNVTFNISTPDVDGFRKSQTQISTMLARSVGRSGRGS